MANANTAAVGALIGTLGLGGATLPPARAADTPELQPVARTAVAEAVDSQRTVDQGQWVKTQLPFDLVRKYLPNDLSRAQIERFYRISMGILSGQQPSVEDAQFIDRIRRHNGLRIGSQDGPADATGSCIRQEACRFVVMAFTGYTKTDTVNETTTVTNTVTVPGPTTQVEVPTTTIVQCQCDQAHLALQEAIGRCASREEVDQLREWVMGLTKVVYEDRGRLDEHLRNHQQQARTPNVVINFHPVINNNSSSSSWSIGGLALQTGAKILFGGDRRGGGCLRPDPCPPVNFGNTPGDYTGSR